jgi:hypothetical protein
MEIFHKQQQNNTIMKALTKFFAPIAAAAIVFGGLFGTPQTAQAQPFADQIAIYLGAITLGYPTDISALTAQQRAEALFNGRGLLRSNVRRTQPLISGQPTVVNVQSSVFQSQLLQATALATTTPITLDISRVQVTLNNGRSAVVNARMDASRLRPSQIFNFIARRVPQYTPLLTQEAIASVFLLNPNNTPVYNFKGRTEAQIVNAMLADASRIGQFAMRTGMGNYPRGTINVPSTELLDFRPGRGGASILPRFTAAIAAQAFLGLPDFDDVQTADFRYDQAASTLITGLVRGANPYTRRNQSAIPGAVAGSIYSVTGMDNSAWSYLSPTDEQITVTAALNGIVFGAARTARNLAAQIAEAAAAAFAATFVANGNDPNDLESENISNSIVIAIQFALGRAFTRVADAVREAADRGVVTGSNPTNIPTIPGALGLNNFEYVNDSPAPVTDITGS